MTIPVRALVALVFAALATLPSVAGTAAAGRPGTLPSPPGGRRDAAQDTQKKKEEAALDISGAWACEVPSAAGTGTPSITFNQSGEKITGQYSGQLGEAPIQGTLKGAELTFSFDVSVQDTKLHVVYTGTATKDALKGTVVLGEFGEGTFTARRK
jgi:hypothetical protein